MTDLTLAAATRTEFGKGAARRIRRAHQIPAVIYGHGAEPLHIALPGHETMMALKHANALLTIVLDGVQHLARHLRSRRVIEEDGRPGRIGPPERREVLPDARRIDGSQQLALLPCPPRPCAQPPTVISAMRIAGQQTAPFHSTSLPTASMPRSMSSVVEATVISSTG